MNYPRWQLSGFRKVAHYIYEDGEYLKAACGTFWWMSDGVSSRDGTNERRCQHCQRTKQVKKQSHD